MEQIDQILGVLGGVAILLVCLGLATRADRSLVDERLRTYLGGVRQTAAVQDELEALRLPADNRHPILRRAGLGAASYMLAQAGLTISPRRFLLIQALSGLGGLLLTRLALGRFGLDVAGTITVLLLLAAGTAVGLALPRLVLVLLRRRRLRRIEQQLPIAIDSIANAIQAGLSLPQAIEVVARDMPVPLGTDLQVVVRELALGVSLEEALDQLAFRIPLRDVEIFVAAVHIQYRTGGSLSEILRSIAHTIRERLRIRGEIRILTAQQRLSAVIVSALPFVIVLAIRFLSPRYFEHLLEPGTMRIMLIVAAFGMIAGAYCLYRIANIEV